MNSKAILLLIIVVDIAILLFQTSSISISAHEANLLYGDFSFIQQIENLSFNLLGHNDLALRLPMILFHILSVFLLYNISKNYLEDERNRLWLILVFVLLPGVLSSALLVDNAGLIIFGLLLFIYAYENFSLEHTYPLLFVFVFIDTIFVYLFVSLVIYSLYKKKKIYLIVNILLLALSLYMFGIDTHGTPRGHLIDTIGLYSAIFTPVIFIYIFYILYRRFLSKEINLLWFISAVPLLISLLLSFRQNIYIEDFAPYLLISLPLAAQSFYASYRVRLKIFRGKYRAIFIASFIFLLVNFFVVLFNRELYVFIDNPQKHFARKMHIAQSLAEELKKKDILCVSTQASMSKRLNFYGIGICNKFLLYEIPLNSIDNENTVTVSYKYRPIYKAIVTNINTK